jgi:sialic acid synthase SpsE/mannose-6-phosphate isomerase-like protein (cupin superfamily)
MTPHPQFDRLYIFEMANNHQGSVEHGLSIIDMVAELAARHAIRAAVKLQFRELDTFIHPDYRGREDVKHIGRFESTRLTKEQFGTLVDATHERGLLSISTPFDEPSVETCLDLGVDIIKAASCSATDWPLLTAIADARRPVIASTGGLDIYDIDNLVSFFHKRVPAFALMHCVSLYPTPSEDVSMNFMGKLIRRYPYVTVGYSGHEEPGNTDVAMAAVAKGARLLERHVGVPTADIRLNAYSLDPGQADLWVAAAERARVICGPADEKSVSDVEKESLRELQRGVFARTAIHKGQPIGREDVFFAMPCQPGQLTSGQFGQLRARYHAAADYAEGAPIFSRPHEDTMRQVRGILHDAKGQIYEAGLALGNDYTIEISHHYGLERFRETGCILLNLINRQYCNKILIMLPQQRHPVHWHKEKEETFHLLWGDLEVQMNGGTIAMTPGDRLLVERGTPHSFSSRSGAIFAEISTRHIVGDSYYEDPFIAELDPMQRKTVLDSW